jgi:hypothetical protein
LTGLIGVLYTGTRRSRQNPSRKLPQKSTEGAKVFLFFAPLAPFCGQFKSGCEIPPGFGLRQPSGAF